MKHVLDVGNCFEDHARLRALLESHFSVRMTHCHSAAEALRVLQREACDLVLVNRIFDLDHSEGLELIRTLKSAGPLADTPCMLVSNYAEHQAAAVAAGALPGFGKRELRAPGTQARLAAVLS